MSYLEGKSSMRCRGKGNSSVSRPDAGNLLRRPVIRVPAPGVFLRARPVFKRPPKFCINSETEEGQLVPWVRFRRLLASRSTQQAIRGSLQEAGDTIPKPVEQGIKS